MVWRVGLAALAVIGMVFGVMLLHANAATCTNDGYRVQAVYAAAPASDRYETVAPQITDEFITTMETDLAASSGGTRAIRWARNPDCSINVAHAVLSEAGADIFVTGLQELQAQGLYEADRRYLTWVDDPDSTGCGTSGRGSITNPSSPIYSWVYSPCWQNPNRSTALHEFTHSLGAVQNAAPHSDGAGHCTDGSDLMCNTGTVCPTSYARLMDCNHDDYFDVTGQLDPLVNVAMSPYLDVIGVSPGPSPSPSPSPSPTVSPSPTPTPSPSCIPNKKNGRNCK
jgi:hypothetical protein